ncbi:amidohydrolase family protein [Sphingomonas aliaeris]|uniref:Amidohydrolase family protein n=2 Tax=Sphingomonas aliaeris TaxID=2759526 RepID=A0A974NSB1_9SPHN|nr:amidohydrolase family protein [Sphingomonas aliaeris]
MSGVLGAAAALVSNAAHAQTYDTIIRGGTIVDGSGLLAFKGDVAIDGKHIAAVGDLGSATATDIIDAHGLVVAPGFINIHSHAQPDAVATAVNMLTQGVTTEITNADGHGTTDITKQLAGFAANGLAENIGLYIGFNAAWAEVVGNDDRRATSGEIARMRDILDLNLSNGAWGVASGLDYKPGYYAHVDEVVGVVSVAGKWRTNFPNHDRIRPEENYSSFKGMAETIAIGEQTGVIPVITHIKTQGAEQGNAAAVIAIMDAATRRGTYTAADVYPYLAGLSGLSLNVPGWAIAGGRDAMLKRFADPATRARIATETETAMKRRWNGPDGIYLFNMGREFADIVREMNVRPGEAVIRLLEQQEHSAILRFGKEEDVIAFLKYRNSAMACDCGASIGQKGHPRGWGSFPRVLGHYVREQKVLTLEDAIRKMTALPAAIIGMNDRGYLAPGMAADIAVFDPRTIRDHATYQEPTKPSEGVRYVVVNGIVALREGRSTATKTGEVVLRTRHMPSRPMTPATMARGLQVTGDVGGHDKSYTVAVSLRQQPGQRAASGKLTLTDVRSGTIWSTERIGTLQNAKGWTSVTAILRDPAGKWHAAMVTLDEADTSSGKAKPTLVVQLDGGADMIGIPK